MPRGKFLNHKGRSRQFTPIEQLQREQELEGSSLDLESGSSVDDALSEGHSVNESNEDSDSTKGKKLGGAVEGLIEISNPNRPLKKSSKLALLSDSEAKGKLTEDSRRRDRAKEKPRSSSNQKSMLEANADLARLALVRKKREAAAELRMAAKRENNLEVTPSTSKSDISVKKKSICNKHKSVNNGSIDSLKKDEHLSKFVKGRNVNKRNVSMQA